MVKNMVAVCGNSMDSELRPRVSACRCGGRLRAVIDLPDLEDSEEEDRRALILMVALQAFGRMASMDALDLAYSIVLDDGFGPGQAGNEAFVRCLVDRARKANCLPLINLEDELKKLKCSKAN